MSKTMYQKNEILEIEWDDTCTTQNWHTPNSKYLTTNDGLSKCKSTGFFYQQTKKSIQISQSLSDDGARCNTQSIPISSITKIRKLAKDKEN